MKERIVNVYRWLYVAVSFPVGMGSGLLPHPVVLVATESVPVQVEFRVGKENPPQATGVEPAGGE